MTTMKRLPASLEEITTPLHADSTKVQQQREVGLRGEFLIWLIDLNAAVNGQIEEGKKERRFLSLL